MKATVRRFAEAVLAYDPECDRLDAFVAERRAAGQPWRLLDVGCGYGRHLRRFVAMGIEACGVDANAAIVASNAQAGLRCFTPEAFDATEDAYDMIVMSHVVEHFAPADLLGFLEHYLDRLKPGGHLLIATPLLSRYFYDDFDHVKPYHPTGLLMVFGPQVAQVQFRARHRLALEDIWYRRSYFRFGPGRGRHFPSPSGRLIQGLELLSALAWRLSGGRLGSTDGWVGVFRKLAP